VKTSNPQVAGSSPAGRAFFCARNSNRRIADLLELARGNLDVGSDHDRKAYGLYQRELSELRRCRYLFALRELENGNPARAPF